MHVFEIFISCFSLRVIRNICVAVGQEQKKKNLCPSRCSWIVIPASMVCGVLELQFEGSGSSIVHERQYMDERNKGTESPNSSGRVEEAVCHIHG